METKTTKIGLDVSKSEQLAEKLNTVLANYQVFYMNARGYHWNIKGEKFFVLHAKFEELYTDLQEKIDELAERILTLGFTPMHLFSDYLEHAEVKVAKNVHDGRKAVEEIVDSFQVILSKQRELLNASTDSGDEGTSALMSDYIREQEKQVWMYSAFLG